MTKRVRASIATLLVCLALSGCSSRAPDGTNEPSVAASSSPSPTPTDPASPAQPSEPASPSAEPEADLEFAAIGDFGARTAEQLSVAGRMCRWLDDHPYELVVTTGDNVYPDGSPELFEDSFFRPYKCLFDAGVRWHASLGNHDYATEQGLPEVTEPAFGMKGSNYVVRSGGVRFVIADSNELDRAWLREELPGKQGDRWTIVVFHHPVLSPGLHGSTPGFEDLPQLFEENGVDLVLNGHDHMYAVTKPQDGIRYVVTGGGGANLYPCLPNATTEVCELEHHFLYIEADPERIVVTAVPAEGPPFDRFTTKGLD